MDETRLRHCIERKRDGKPLTEQEWEGIIDAYMDGRVDDAPMASLFMACVWRGMSFDETFAITDAMVRSGATLSFDGVDHVVDKHSSGGVSDIVSLVAVPLAAACGARVAKLSGRALGHTGGTIDKLEAIPGVSTTMSLDAFVKQVKTVGCAIAAQTEAIVPADKRIYHLRDRTATVPAIGLIAGSIVSKKIAVGAPAIVYDVKTGAASYTPTPERARELAQWIVEITKRFGRKSTAFVTDMDQPLGDCIGTGIEAVEARDLLRGAANDRARTLIITIAAQMLALSGIPDGENRARKALEDGSAYEKFVQLIEAQGGSRKALESMQLDPDPLKIPAPYSGSIQSMDVKHLGNVGRHLAQADALGGLRVSLRIGDKVKAGDVLALAYGRDKARAQTVAGAFKIASTPVTPPPLVYEVIGE